ncbi:unnamed protein product [Euphydryas editha]|uniref:Uncharacterized protein n=1 Tax=Euphydryas editha TaxID=104508 RepID=A0AAU9TFK8_EUPED|nr:unnamed protein product [Euphydryas editha]
MDLTTFYGVFDGIEFKQQAEKKIKSMEQHQIYLEKCNKALEERVIVLEQKEKKKNVEIVGLEKQEKEDLKEVIITLANKLSLDTNEIEEVKRVGQEKVVDNKRKTQPVIIKLRTKSAREQWLKLRKQHNITNDDIYGNKNKHKIYINEDLSKYFRQLFWLAKKELKESYKYIWIQNSKILIKANESEKKIHNIKCEDDVRRLLKRRSEKQVS